MSENQLVDYDAYRSLEDALGVELQDILDRIADNGSVTLKPGSPAVAVLTGLAGLVRDTQSILELKMDLMRKAYEA